MKLFIIIFYLNKNQIEKYSTNGINWGNIVNSVRFVGWDGGYPASGLISPRERYTWK